MKIRRRVVIQVERPGFDDLHLRFSESFITANGLIVCRLNNMDLVIDNVSEGIITPKQSEWTNDLVEVVVRRLRTKLDLSDGTVNTRPIVSAMTDAIKFVMDVKP